MTAKPQPKSKARKPSAPPAARTAKPKSSARTAKTSAIAPATKAARPAAPKAPQGDGDGDGDGHGAPVKPSELSGEVMEFINAIDEYKRTNRRPFPSWSEVFEIVRSLGYDRER